MFKMFEKCLKEGVKRRPLFDELSQILQSDVEAIYHDQTTVEGCKLGTMYISFEWRIWSIRFPKFGNLTFLWVKKGQICILYSNYDKKIKFNNYGFFKISSSFLK